MDSLEQSSKPTATLNATKWGVHKFAAWIEKRNLTCDWASISPQDFNNLLRRFYGEVKHHREGETLTPSSFTGIRAALHRHITSPPYSRDINIIRDREFTSANNMFTAKCKLYYKNGNKKPVHKPTISEGDMITLGKYLAGWKTNPRILLEATWFYLCFYFGRRGREGWCSMTKNTFQVKDDTEGHRYVTMSVTETTKNHQGGHRQREQDYSDQRMYGEGVNIFSLYVSKLHPDCVRLFQNPLHVYQLDKHWYRNEPAGKNTMSTMMQGMSVKAGLSMKYTCHSVRASTITALFRAGVPTQSIVAITKHKSTNSLGHYISDLSNQQKRDCSGVLTTALSGPQPQVIMSSIMDLTNLFTSECIKRQL